LKIITALSAKGGLFITCAARLSEPSDAWSLKNLIAEQGEMERPRVGQAHLYTLDLTIPATTGRNGTTTSWSGVWANIARARNYRLLFHNMHHRSITDAKSVAAYDLSNYDGVLAFGEVIRDLYLSRG
jgi:hypothetical protein